MHEIIHLSAPGKIKLLKFTYPIHIFLLNRTTIPPGFFSSYNAVVSHAYRPHGKGFNSIIIHGTRRYIKFSTQYFAA